MVTVKEQQKSTAQMGETEHILSCVLMLLSLCAQMSAFPCSPLEKPQEHPCSHNSICENLSFTSSMAAVHILWYTEKNVDINSSLPLSLYFLNQVAHTVLLNLS